MKIENKTLLSVSNDEIINGTFTVPEGIISIGNDAFYYCSKLKEIILPKNLTSIGNNAFSYCSNLNEIILPQEITLIGNDAFWNCSNLNAIILPKNLTSIGNWAFFNCYNLKKINNLNVKCIDGDCFVIKSQKKINDYIILKGYNYQLNEPKELIFVAEREKFTAHGETIEKSIEDLNFKIYSEKVKSEPIELEQVMTIQHYRIITGACELGIKEWMKNHNIKEGIKVKNLISILKETNAYGMNKFLSLVKN